MRRLTVRLALAAGIALLTLWPGGEVFAQNAGTPQSAYSNCTCRFNGERYHLGDVICLKSPTGPQLAQCDMVLNNTSWTFTGNACVYSLRQQTTPGIVAWSAQPQAQK